MLQPLNPMLVLYPRPESFIGKEFDGYRIDSILGTGGMGIVFKATQIELERQVALKIINPSLAQDDSFWHRFKAEAHALAKIHHPNIVVIYNFRPSDQGFYIAMEYVSGNTLAKYIQKKGRIAWTECILLAKQILSALQSTHKAGIIHRDIKPSNILINDNHFVKITDFGLAKVQSTTYKPDDSTVTLDTAGTLSYMPPELVRGLRKVDHRGDIYSVGLTLYEALAGRLPFEKEGTGYEIQKRIVEKPFIPLKKSLPEIPKELSRVIMKAIEKEPHRRYQSAEEMLKDLEAIDPIKSAPKKSYSFSSKPLASSTSLPVQPASKPLVVPLILAVLIGIVILSFTPLSVTQIFSNNSPAKPRTLAEQIQANTKVLSEQSAKTIYTADSTISNGDRDGIESIPTKEDSLTTPVDTAPEQSQEPALTPASSSQGTRTTTQPPARSYPPTHISTPTTGSIRVISVPNDSEVFLNGTWIGNTPLFLDNIPAGSFEMEIRKPNHEPQTFRQTVSPLEITYIDSELKPIQGFLQLTIEPPSDVYLNNQRLTQRPTAVFEREVIATTHELSVTHPNYGEWKRSINISASDTTKYTIDFSKEIKVAVTAFDESNKGLHAEILLDNKQTGKYTPAQLSIPPGSHVISVKLDGYSLSEEAESRNYESSTSSPLRFVLKKKP